MRRHIDEGATALRYGAMSWRGGSAFPEGALAALADQRAERWGSVDLFPMDCF